MTILEIQIKMSQTPRKFSEKIAILERKTRAESDDFQSIMQDVSFNSNNVTQLTGKTNHCNDRRTFSPNYTFFDSISLFAQWSSWLVIRNSNSICSRISYWLNARRK
jgi:hypothetical protein